MRILADYLAVSCHGLSVSHLDRQHDSMQYNSHIHYHAVSRITRLPSVSFKPANDSIAMWIQVGQSDILYHGIGQVYHTGIDKYVKYLISLKQQLKSSHTNVDFMVFLPSSIPDTHLAINNFVTGALNAKLRKMLSDNDIRYIDLFQFEYPCKDDKAGNMTINHYMDRYERTNTPVGNVGRAIYVNYFIGGKCADFNTLS